MSNLTHSDGYGTGTGNATLLADPSLCTLQTCDLSMASFLYLPTVGGNALYAGIFGIMFVGQLYLGIRHKTWGYMIAMLCGLALEIVGYVSRVMLNSSPFNNNDFLIYLICLTIAPGNRLPLLYRFSQLMFPSSLPHSGHLSLSRPHCPRLRRRPLPLQAPHLHSLLLRLRLHLTPTSRNGRWYCINSQHGLIKQPRQEHHVSGLGFSSRLSRPLRHVLWRIRSPGLER